MDIVPIATVEGDRVEALLDRAFGPDRQRRTAYRLRAGLAPLAGLSFAAVDGAALLGMIQCWPIALACDSGPRVPLVLVGPVAVEPAHQRGGLGRALMARMLAADDGAAALALIGDPEYYGRFFGFDAARTGRWRLPGPFEPRRLLARGDAPDCAGMLGPRG